MCDDGSSADARAGPDCDLGEDGGVGADEHGVADPAAAADHSTRHDCATLANDSVVADLGALADGGVRTDAGERRHRAPGAQQHAAGNDGAVADHRGWVSDSRGRCAGDVGSVQEPRSGVGHPDPQDELHWRQPDLASAAEADESPAMQRCDLACVVEVTEEFIETPEPVDDIEHHTCVRAATQDADASGGTSHAGTVGHPWCRVRWPLRVASRRSVGCDLVHQLESSDDRVRSEERAWAGDCVGPDLAAIADQRPELLYARIDQPSLKDHSDGLIGTFVEVVCDDRASLDVHVRPHHAVADVVQMSEHRTVEQPARLDLARRSNTDGSTDVHAVPEHGMRTDHCLCVNDGRAVEHGARMHMRRPVDRYPPSATPKSTLNDLTISSTRLPVPSASAQGERREKWPNDVAQVGANDAVAIVSMSPALQLPKLGI